MPSVLVELPDGEGVVCRDDGEIVVTHDVSGDRGQPLRSGDPHHPVKTWLDDDRSLVGGLLPPGAVRAEVIDDRGTRVAAKIGGRRQPTRMVAPALVAVDVPTGTDHVVFRFHGYGYYPELLALSGLTLAMVAVAPVCVRRARSRRASAGARSGGTTRAAAQARAR